MFKTTTLTTALASLAFVGAASAGTLTQGAHWIVGSENTGGQDYNVSVTPGGYTGFSSRDGGAANGAVNETFNNPIVDYGFFRQQGNDPGALEYAGGAANIIGLPTSTSEGGAYGTNAPKVWSTTDPTAAWNDPADRTSNTYYKVANASGSIDISTLDAGSAYFFYRAYRNQPSIDLTMSGTGQSNVLLEDAGDDDYANNNEHYVVRIDFGDASLYDTISYTFSIPQANAGRGGLAGIVVTAVPEPSSLALLGLGGLLIARRRR